MLFHESTYKLEEIVTYFLIRLIRNDASGKNMVLVDTSNQNDSANVFKEYRRQTGKCYSFHPNKLIASLGIYYIRMKL